MMSFSLNKLHCEVKLHSIKQSLSSHGLYWVRKELVVLRSQPRGTLHKPRPDLDDAVPQWLCHTRVIRHQSTLSLIGHIRLRSEPLCIDDKY